MLAYLARYTHRVAIGNQRLQSFDNDQVTFQWKDYRHRNRIRNMTLDAHEFIRRFLIHALPPGFQRIRHYGFLANAHRREKLELCRKLLNVPLRFSSPRGSLSRRLGRLPGTAVFRRRLADRTFSSSDFQEISSAQNQ